MALDPARSLDRVPDANCVLGADGACSLELASCLFALGTCSERVPATGEGELVRSESSGV